MYTRKYQRKRPFRRPLVTLLALVMLLSVCFPAMVVDTTALTPYEHLVNQLDSAAQKESLTQEEYAQLGAYIAEAYEYEDIDEDQYVELTSRYTELASKVVETDPSEPSVPESSSSEESSSSAGGEESSEPSASSEETTEESSEPSASSEETTEESPEPAESSEATTPPSLEYLGYVEDLADYEAKVNALDSTAQDFQSSGDVINDGIRELIYNAAAAYDGGTITSEEYAQFEQKAASVLALLEAKGWVDSVSTYPSGDDEEEAAITLDVGSTVTNEEYNYVKVTSVEGKDKKGNSAETVRITVEDGKLKITGILRGTATVKVEYTDDEGMTRSTTLSVVINNASSGWVGYYLTLDGADFANIPISELTENYNWEYNGKSSSKIGDKYVVRTDDTYRYHEKFTVHTEAPYCAGYAFVGWLDKEYPSNENYDPEKHSYQKPAQILHPSDEGEWVRKNTENGIQTLDAIWASIDSLDKVLPYDGDTHRIDSATLQLNNGGLAEVYVEQASQIVEIGDQPTQYRIISYRDTAGSTTTYDTEFTTAIPTGTDAGVYTYEIKGTVEVDGQQVELTTTATLTITPIEIELKAGSAEKPYDGEPLTCSDYSITVGQFVTRTDADGNPIQEGLASVTIEGSRTDPGERDNVITGHTLNQNTSANNYVITYKEGTLKVTPRAITTDPGKLTIKVNKEWDDNNNANRPGSIQVYLQGTKTPDKEDSWVTLRDNVTITPVDGVWTYEFDVSEYAYTYFRIREVVPNGYEATYTDPQVTFTYPSSTEWTTITPCNELNWQTYNKESTIVAVNKGNTTYIWTWSALTDGERDLIEASIGNVSNLKAKNYVFLSGVGASTNGITVTNTEISFGDPSNWSLFGTGTYSKGSASSTDAQIENKLSATTVTITKTVTGNMGDTTKLFDFYYKIGESGTETHFQLSNGNINTISDLQIGQYLYLREENGSYTVSVTYPGVDDDGKTVSIQADTVTDSNNVTWYEIPVSADLQVSVVNDLEATIDTGITTTSYPFILLLSTTIVAGFVLLMHKRRYTGKF